MSENMLWKVYIVRCADNSYYTGISNNVAARIKKHNLGKGAAYTRGRGPVELAYSEDFPDRSSASKRECAIKKLARGQKEKLILKN